MFGFGLFDNPFSPFFMQDKVHFIKLTLPDKKETLVIGVLNFDLPDGATEEQIMRAVADKMKEFGVRSDQVDAKLGAQ